MGLPVRSVQEALGLAAADAECWIPMKGALSPTAGPTVGMREKRHSQVSATHGLMGSARLERTTCWSKSRQLRPLLYWSVNRPAGR